MTQPTPPSYGVVIMASIMHRESPSLRVDERAERLPEAAVHLPGRHARAHLCARDLGTEAVAASVDAAAAPVLG